MYRYRVRPGYGSTNLLIEFCADSTSDDFVETLRTVLKNAGLRSRSTEELWPLGTSAHFRGAAGEFEIIHDEWCQIWIQAEKDQDSIHFLDRLLAASGLFEKEEVDFKVYAQPATPPYSEPAARSPQG